MLEDLHTQVSKGIPSERRIYESTLVRQRQNFVRPDEWDDSQVGFRGCNVSGGRIVLLPGAFWAHGTSKMATLGASLLLCILQCFRA